MQQKKQNKSVYRKIRKNEILFEQILDKGNTFVQNHLKEFNNLEQQIIKFQEEKDKQLLKGNQQKVVNSERKIANATEIKVKLKENLDQAKEFQKVVQLQIEKLKLINQINPKQIQPEKRFANLQILNDISMEIANQINQQQDKSILVLLNKFLKHVKQAELNQVSDQDKDSIKVYNQQNDENIFDQVDDSENSENDDSELSENDIDEQQFQEKKQQIKSDLMKILLKKNNAQKRLKEIDEKIDELSQRFISINKNKEELIKFQEQKKWVEKEIHQDNKQIKKLQNKLKKLQERNPIKKPQDTHPQQINEENLLKEDQNQNFEITQINQPLDDEQQKIINQKMIKLQQLFNEIDEEKLIDELKKLFTEEKNFMCQICGKHKNQYVPLPCKHFICCGICQQNQITNCVMCDQPIQKMFKIFN